MFQHATEKILTHLLLQNRQGTHVSIVDTTNARLKFIIDEDDFTQAKKKIEIVIQNGYTGKMIYHHFMLVSFVQTKNTSDT